MFGRNTGKPLKGPTMGAHTILVTFINFIQTYLNKSVFAQCTATGLTHLLQSAAISYQISARDDRLLHLVSVHCETIFQFFAWDVWTESRWRQNHIFFYDFCIQSGGFFPDFMK